MLDIIILINRDRARVFPCSDKGKFWIIYNMDWMPEGGKVTIQSDLAEELASDMRLQGLQVDIR